MVISDGFTGYARKFVNDTLVITEIMEDGPADKAGLKANDIVIYIDSFQVTAADRWTWEVMKQESFAAYTTHEYIIKRDDSIHNLTLVAGFDIKSGRDLDFEYLIDSSGLLTIDDILQIDSSQHLFYSHGEKKLMVGSVEAGSNAERTGIRKGDVLVSMKKVTEVSLGRSHRGNDWGLEDGFIRTRSKDSILIVQRNGEEIKLQADMKEDPLRGFLSQYYLDIHEACMWFKIKLQTKNSENRKYLFSFHPDDLVTLYSLSQDGTLSQRETGRTIIRRDKEQNLRGMNPIAVTLGKEESLTVYVRLEKRDGVVRGYPRGAYIAAEWFEGLELKVRMLVGLFWGMMLIVALYYLILFFFVWERSYLLYSLFIVSALIFLLRDSGYMAEFLSQTLIVSNGTSSVLFNISVAFPLTLFVVFGMSFLELRSRLTKWYRVSIILLGVCWFGLVMELILNQVFGLEIRSQLFMAFDLLAAFCLSISPFILVIPTILSIRKKYKPAWFFLLANVILLIFLGVYVFYVPQTNEFYTSDIGVIVNSVVIQVGAVVQILLFAVALGQKMNQGEREKKAAQQKVIEQLKENEKLQDKVNRELEHKVQERTEEILAQKEEIEAQRDLMSEQKKAITDSINYAYKIQSAVMPSRDYLDSCMPEYFVLYKPRDIVSGDFYWVREVKNFLIVVAADCTGHGVPGAFMSMLGITLLNEIIGKSRFDKAGEMLDRLRAKVKKTLAQEGKLQEQKDGMDMAMAVIDNETLELQYAGAFNPLYIIRKQSIPLEPVLENSRSIHSGDASLFELKADRQPISIHENEKEFTTNTLQLYKGDSLYMFSDGFADQIGGPRGKKFLSKQFKKVLLDIQKQALDEQHGTLNSILEEWRKGYEQVDDILVLGIRM